MVLISCAYAKSRFSHDSAHNKDTIFGTIAGLPYGPLVKTDCLLLFLVLLIILQCSGNRP